jgi:hypothetical protein
MKTLLEQFADMTGTVRILLGSRETPDASAGQLMPVSPPSMKFGVMPLPQNQIGTVLL